MGELVVDESAPDPARFHDRLAGVADVATEDARVDAPLNQPGTGHDQGASRRAYDTRALTRLQHTAGNRAVTNLVQGWSQARDTAPSPTGYARTDDARRGPDHPPTVTTRDIQPADADHPPTVTTRDIQPADADHPPAGDHSPVVTTRDIQAGGYAAPVRARGGGSPTRAAGPVSKQAGGAGGRKTGGGKKAPAPKPVGAGAGGGAGGGGGADPLSRWKASAAAATGAVPAPDLAGAAAGPGRLADQAQQLDQQRRSAQPDFGQEAKAMLPDPPAEPPREKLLDTGPADSAVSVVEKAGAGRLSDQTFPPAKPLPVYQGGGGGGGSAPAIPAAARGPAPAGGPASGGPTAVDPKADEVRTKVAAVTPTAAGAGAPQPIVLQDKGAASLTPPSPGQGQQIGDVLAKVKLKVDGYAQAFVVAAAAKLDPQHSVAKLTEMANGMKSDQVSSISAEIDGVAAAAGVTAEALNAKVQAEKDKAKAQGDATSSGLAAQGDAATGQVQARGQDESKAVTGARQAADSDVDQRQAAADGAPDPAVITAKRDGYLERIDTARAGGVAAYKAAGESRAAQLDQAGEQQKTHYRGRARTESARIKGLFPDDATKGKIEARPVLDWAEQQALEVDAIVARLKKTATAEVVQLQNAVNDAAGTARNQVRDWAASKEGRQRSWWDRLMDSIRDWASRSKADTKAWEAQRNAQTRDAVAGDFDMLVRLRDQLAADNKEAVAAEMAKLSAEQKLVVAAFLKDGGQDPVGAVAVGLVERLKTRRVPEITTALQDKAIAELGSEDLNAIGRAQSPGFDAGLIIRDVRGSVKGMGTDENRLFKALQGRTPIQIAAMRKAYAATYDGRNMDEDIYGDVDFSEVDRAKAMLSGDPVASAAATLNDAMWGAGTDEKLVMDTLRGKTPAERDAILAKYQEMYGVDLHERIKDDMEDNDRDQAEALLAGDTTKADAIALNEAVQGPGTDEDAIHAVYSRIRDEVEAEARRKGMTTAEVNAEIERRTGAIKSAYGAKYAGGDPNQLEADFRDDLEDGELRLVLAEQANDQTAMDAARIQIEHEGLYTDDDKVNAVLRAQHDRAEKEVMRDLEVEFTEQSATMTPEQRRRAREDMKARAETLIKERAQQNMTALQERYDADNPDFGFQTVMDLELQGYSHDEAKELIAAGGKLDDAHELKYAIFGAGTNEDRIRDVLKGKSKEEIDKLKAEYKALTGNDLAEDLEGDLAGRDLADNSFLLDGSSTPEEKLAYLRRRKEWEVDEGTGVLGELFENEEEDVLERTTAGAGEAYDRYQQALKQFGPDDPRTQAALEEFERWSGYSDKDIEEHRAELDAFTDGLATGAAIVAGLAVSIATAGAAAPAAVAGVAALLGTSAAVVSAAAGAIAATAAGMLTKELMKGGAYDIEAIAVDMAQGLVESVVAVYTVGMGEAALEALFKNPAFKTLKEAAASGRLGTVIRKGIESGVEGALQGVPSGMTSAILNENTWRGKDPFATIIAAGGQASLQGAAMGTVMGGAMEAATGGKPGAGTGEGGGTHEGGGGGEAGGTHDTSSGEAGGAGPSVDDSGPAATADETGPAPTTDETGPAPTTDETGPTPTTDEASPAPTTDQSGPSTSGGENGQAPSGGEGGGAYDSAGGGGDEGGTHDGGGEGGGGEGGGGEGGGDLQERIDKIRERYGDDAADPEAFDESLKELEKLAKNDPAAAKEALDAFDQQARGRDVESAFDEAGQAGSKEEKLTGGVPGEEPVGVEVGESMNRRTQATRDSDVLAAAMEALGDPRPPGHDTHHIVAADDPRAELARQILESAGINPRYDPQNGIHLPRTSLDPHTIPEAASRHQTIHTNEYYKELTRRLRAAQKRGTVPEALAKIKEDIANGRFPSASSDRPQTWAEFMLEHRHDVYGQLSDEEFARLYARAKREDPDFVHPDLTDEQDL